MQETRTRKLVYLNRPRQWNVVTMEKGRMAILVNNRRGERSHCVLERLSIIDYRAGTDGTYSIWKDPECIIELSREKWDVPGTSGDSPLA